MEWKPRGSLGLTVPYPERLCFGLNWPDIAMPASKLTHRMAARECKDHPVMGGDTHPVTTTQHSPLHDSAHAQLSCDFARWFAYSLVLHGRSPGYLAKYCRSELR